MNADKYASLRAALDAGNLVISNLGSSLEFRKRMGKFDVITTVPNAEIRKEYDFIWLDEATEIPKDVDRLLRGAPNRWEVFKNEPKS